MDSLASLRKAVQVQSTMATTALGINVSIFAGGLKTWRLRFAHQVTTGDAIVWWSAGCAIRKRDLQNLVVLHLSLWNVLGPEWEQMTQSTWTYITSNTIKPIVDNIVVSDIASELVRVDKCLCHWDLQNEARPSDWIKGCGSSMIEWESGGAQGDGSICQKPNLSGYIRIWQVLYIIPTNV